MTTINIDSNEAITKMIQQFCKEAITSKINQLKHFPLIITLVI